MGIFKDDEEFGEAGLDEAIRDEGPSEDTAPDDAREVVTATGNVRVRVTHAHNGLKRGDTLSVSAERADALLKAGVAEVA